jgi:hypothetical protein
MRHPDGELTFRRSDGVPIPVSPIPPEWGPVEQAGPLALTTARLAEQGIAIDARTTTPRSDGERLDLGWALDVLYVPAGTSPHRH